MILRREPSWDAVERLGLAFPLGAGMLTLQMFLLGLLRVPLTLPWVGALIVAELIGSGGASGEGFDSASTASAGEARINSAIRVRVLIVIDGSTNSSARRDCSTWVGNRSSGPGLRS